MSAAARAAEEWWNDHGHFGEDFPTGVEHDKDDMLCAFMDGWNAAMSSEWVDADGPIGPAHPKAPRKSSPKG